MLASVSVQMTVRRPPSFMVDKARLVRSAGTVSAPLKGLFSGGEGDWNSRGYYEVGGGKGAGKIGVVRGREGGTGDRVVAKLAPEQRCRCAGIQIRVPAAQIGACDQAGAQLLQYDRTRCCRS